RPVHAIGGDVHEVERRLGVGVERHREHDAIADARELAEADERGAVGEEYSEERRFFSAARSATRRRRRQQQAHDDDGAGPRRDFHQIASVLCHAGAVKAAENRLWKSCGRPVHFLLSKRQRKIFFEADQPAKTPRGGLWTSLRLSLRLIAGGRRVKSVSLSI